MSSCSSVVTCGVASVDFSTIWHNKDLRKYIHNVAKSNGGTPEDVEDMESEAWARLSRMRFDLPVSEYKREAYRGIESERRQQYLKRASETQIDILEICPGEVESLNFFRARARGRYAGQGLLTKACRGIHGTICSFMLTFEISIALQNQNTDWLGSEEYWNLRNEADAELEETEHEELD